MTFDETLVLAMEKINAFVDERREEFVSDVEAAGGDVDEIYKMLEEREPALLAELQQQIKRELAAIYMQLKQPHDTVQ
jgi:hypothetical protein